MMKKDSIFVSKVKYDDYYELGEVLVEQAVDNEVDACFIGDFDDVSEALRGVYAADTDDDLVIMELCLESAEVCGYDGPYMLQVTKNFEIWCSKALTEKEPHQMLGYENDVIYVTHEYVGDAIRSCFNKETALFFDVGIYCEDDSESIFDENENVCFHWDDERQLGFVYCTCGDFGREKIVYQGTKKLTEADVARIVDEYMN